jgi:hypothetical protein
LNVEATKLQAATANVLDVEGFKATDLGVEDALNRLNVATTTQSFEATIKAATATVEVVIEALLIKTTFETLTKLLAKAVAKEAASLTIGAGGAAIPGVDIVTTTIAVGGTLLTAYDVYGAVEEMKKVEPTIRGNLNDSVQAIEKKTEAAFTSLDQTVGILCNTN